MKNRKLLTWILVLAMLLPVLSACAKHTPTPTKAPAATKAPAPTKAPAGPQLGTKDNPIKMVFVPSGNTQAILTGAKELDNLLQKQTGLYFKSSVATSYAAAIEAMCAGKADVGWLSTFAYVLAHDKCGVEVKLVTVRYGKPYYRGQIIVRADSGIKTLDDLKGKKFAFVDPASTSGYLYPSAMFKEHGIDPDKDFKQVVFAGSHNAVVLAVYKGQVDAGATYEDARGTIAKDFPDVKEKVKVIAYTPKIPNDTVSVRKDLPEGLKKKIANGLLALSKTEAGKKVLKDIYEIGGLAPGNDAMYDPVRKTAKLMGINLEEAIQPKKEKPKATPTKKAAAGKKVTIEVYYPVAVDAPIAKILKGYIADFEKEYPNITVKPVFSGGYGDVKTTIQTTIEGGGKPPALAVMLATDLYDLVNADYIVPLDDYIKNMKDGDAYINDFFPAFMANSKYDGKIWSIPFQRSVVVMYYNADLFQKEGIKPPDSWESWAQAAQKLTIPGKRWGIEYPSGWPYWLFQPLAIGNGQNIVESPTKVVFDNPKVIEAVQFYIDLSHKYKAMPEGVQKVWGSAPADFAKGAAAMIVHSSGSLNGILKQANFKVGVMPIPGKEKGTYATVPGGGNFYIMKKAPKEERDAAWKFIEFVTQPKYAADFSINTGYVATRKSAYETDAMKKHIQEVPQAGQIKDMLKYAGMELSCMNLGKVRNIFHKYLQAAYNGQMTPAEAMKKAQQEADKALAPFK